MTDAGIQSSATWLVGIDIDHASSKVNLKTITLSQLPGTVDNAA